MWVFIPYLFLVPGIVKEWAEEVSRIKIAQIVFVQLAAGLPGSKLCRMLLLVSTKLVLLEVLGSFPFLGVEQPSAVFAQDWAFPKLP